MNPALSVPAAPDALPAAIDQATTGPRRFLTTANLVRFGILALAAGLRLWDIPLRPPHFDEGVNGWFTDQMQINRFYAYDPTNYHGPLHFYVLFLFKCLFGREVWALRVPVIIVGILTVELMFRFGQFFGRRLCAWAALAMAVSPAFLYYQRDAIHEAWLVYFLVLAFWGLCGLVQDGGKRFLWAVGMGVTGMILTKETYVIHLGCLLVAVPILVLVENYLPSTVRPLFAAPVPTTATPTPEEADAEAGRTLWADPLPPPPMFPRFSAGLAPQRWRDPDLLAVIGVGLLLITLFYSGFFFNPKGIQGLVTSIQSWGHKGNDGEGHSKPFYYWALLIWRHEPWVLLGTLASIRYAFFPGVRDWRLRLLAIYGPGTELAYSIVHYKTPWCPISFAWPFFFIAAAMVIEARDRLPQIGGRWVVPYLAAILSGWSFYQAVWLSFLHPTDDKQDYVYVQTFDDVWKIVNPLLAAAEEDPSKYHLRGVILCGSTYPLPWLLGDFTKIGYYSDNLSPPEYQEDFMLVSEARVTELESHLREDYFKEVVHLRPAQEPLTVYFRVPEFERFFQGRTPEFHAPKGAVLPDEDAAPKPPSTLPPEAENSAL